MAQEFKGWPHLLLSGFGCSGIGRKHLSDLDFIYEFLYALPEKIGMQRLGTPNVEKVSEKNHVDPGVTGMVIIYTSHISIHTFTKGQKDGKRKPRNLDLNIHKPFFTADVYSCKEFDHEEAIEQFVKSFRPKYLEKNMIYRLREDPDLIEVERL